MKKEMTIDRARKVLRGEVIYSEAEMWDARFVAVDVIKKYKKLQADYEARLQEPKTGHWIMTGDYYTGAYGSLDYVRCSCCNYESLEEGNYCPNCGAKMESEDT